MNEDKTKGLREQIKKLGGELSDWDFTDETAKKPQPTSWDDLDKISFPNDRWLVKDIFPKEGVSMLASVSGEGKSLIIMHLAKCISEGKSWFNNPRFQTQKSKVLYVNLEMSISEMQRRGRLIGFSKNNKNLLILNEDDFNLNDYATFRDFKYRWLLSFIVKNEIKVLIIDTFRPASGGLREDKAEEVRKFFLKFQVIKNSGVSVIFTEHLRKPNPVEGRKPKKEQVLGSQDKVSNLEVLMMIKKDDTTGETQIYQRKNRLGREVAPFSIKISDGTDTNGSPMINFDYVGEIEDDTNKKDEARGLILDILSSEESKTTNEFITLLKKQVGQKNVRQALRELENRGEIEMFNKTGRQNTYRLQKGETELKDA